MTAEIRSWVLKNIARMSDESLGEWRMEDGEKVVVRKRTEGKFSVTLGF